MLYMYLLFAHKLFCIIQPLSKPWWGAVCIVGSSVRSVLDDLRLRLDFFPPHNFTECPQMWIYLIVDKGGFFHMVPTG